MEADVRDRGTTWYRDAERTGRGIAVVIPDGVFVVPRAPTEVGGFGTDDEEAIAWHMDIVHVHTWIPDSPLADGGFANLGAAGRGDAADAADIDRSP